MELVGGIATYMPNLFRRISERLAATDIDDICSVLERRGFRARRQAPDVSIIERERRERDVTIASKVCHLPTPSSDSLTSPAHRNAIRLIV